MFSEVARHHPHPHQHHQRLEQNQQSFSQPLYPHQYSILQDLPPNAALGVLHNGKHSPLQNASFKQRAERLRQNVRPLRNAVALPQQQPVQTPYLHNSESSEHMLRRKTPNGTLAAGYEGSAVEWTKRPHATKHYLTPASQAPETASFDWKHADNGASHIVPHKESSLGLRAAEQYRLQSYRKDAPGEVLGGSTLNGDSKPKHGWNYSANAPVGIDSVLHQSSFCHHNYNLASTHHVPTVLQPMWPPYLGPTSIHSPGPCGPYWPDGAFEPYRPAPIQDPRFQDLTTQQIADYSAQVRPAVNTYGQWLQAHGDLQHPFPFDHSFTSNQSNGQEKDQDFVSTNCRHSPASKRGSLLVNREMSTSQQHLETSLAYRNRPPTWQDQNGQAVNGTFQIKSVSNPGPPASPLSSLQSLVPSASNAQFKEKILVWAHRIYSDLLTSIEQARRLPLNDQQSQSSQLSSSFYVQPPRRPYPSWSSAHRCDIRSLSGSQSSLPQPLRVNTNDSEKDLKIFKNQSRIASDNQAMLSYSSSTFASPLSNSQSQQRWPSRDGSIRCHPVPNIPSYIPTQLASDLHATSPSAAANYAVEILGRLCQESELEWTDGMLLAGCLAYGLGDYDKAMKWYIRVLQRDSENVEALSNLAATFLALNRREDAKNHWFRSVKLRPSYFEATEHLIGLLHEEHRGREAVKVIEYVEHALRVHHTADQLLGTLSGELLAEDHCRNICSDSSMACGFGSSGYAIPPFDNGRMLALVHGKGNMLYQLGDNAGAAQAFEDAILIGASRRHSGIRGLIQNILSVFMDRSHSRTTSPHELGGNDLPILLTPDMALDTSRLVFPPHGRLPGLEGVPDGFSQKAAISIVSNSLLSLAKIYQDGMSSSGATAAAPRATSGVQEILALYYLSLSLQPSPSTANNVGILLASVQQSAHTKLDGKLKGLQSTSIPGVTPGSGVALALAYYDYGLKLDTRHAHLYTNLGSLFKDIGQLQAAIKMYEKAVECDGNFDIALANLANAVKDQGKVSDAIVYYRRAVSSNPDFAEAVCGLANALNSVCSWNGRGGIHHLGSNRDRWHVDEQGDLYDSKKSAAHSRGWIDRVVAIVEKQLHDGEGWGKGVLHSVGIERLFETFSLAVTCSTDYDESQESLKWAMKGWAGHRWEGARVVRIVERATKNIVRQLYLHDHIDRTHVPSRFRLRPQLPAALAVPSAPTVLPFHTFTCPLSAKQIRKISQRNGLRVSCSTLRAPWLSAEVYGPPAPPDPHLNVGYISSDFNNHPLAHLMQSVFGLHDRNRVKAFCYATTASDGSIHRQQIEREAPVFHDASSWPIDRLVNRVVADGIHILINLNGYTRGARNEVFAARPAPIQMSFMGFAGTLGAEWCDYLLADEIAVPPRMLRPWRGNVDLLDQVKDGNNDDDQDDWVYGENIIFTRDTFFCCDHRQSAPDSQEAQVSWADEQRRRWRMRKDLFPDLSDDAVILGNFNQLYKIEPTTFRTWLRILSRIPKAVLWLLKFPELGEENLRETAMRWVGTEVASRIIFTDVAPKHQHISRARICDLFIDTPECNAHTTAADVLWSGTPLLTLPRYEYKMCSRMAASILRGALPNGVEGERAARDLIADSDESYEEQAVELGSDLSYSTVDGIEGIGRGRLMELRKLLYESRWTSALFDTQRWVRDLESAYLEAWRRWVAGEGGDIWI